MRKRILFIILLFMMLWLLPGGIAFAYTFGFNTVDDFYYDNTISDTSGGETLQITSSVATDSVTNFSGNVANLPFVSDLMDGHAVSIAHVEDNGTINKPQGTITVSLTSGKPFIVNSFVCGSYMNADTLTITTGSTNETFPINFYNNSSIEPSIAFAGITSFTMSWNIEQEMYFDNFSISPVTNPVITLHPSNTTAVSGSASFSVAAVGNILSYQWQVDTTGTLSSFENVSNGGVYSGATTASLSLSGVTTEMNNYLYRCVVTNTDGGIYDTTSNSAKLTVNTPVSISVQPVAATVNVGNNTSFSVTAAGTAPLSYQWQVDTTGTGSSFTSITNVGVYSGATTSMLSITGATGTMNQYLYRVVVTGTSAIPANTVNSNNARLTVYTNPVINTQPANITVDQGSNTSFTVGASGDSLTYQWQVNSGSGFANITNGGVYSGSTTSTLQITGATLGMNGYRYQCIVSGIGSLSTTSSAATLSLHLPANITGHPVNCSVNERANTSLTVVAEGSSLTYQWQVNTGSGFSNITNGVIYSGATTATLTIMNATELMNGYTYRVIVNGSALVVAISNTAQLTVIPTYIITYVGTGSTSGSVPLDNNAYIEGATAIIKNNSGNLSRAGYSFKGWNTSLDGSGVSYSMGDNLVIGKDDISLYAQWTLNTTPPPPPTPPTSPTPSLEDTVPRMDDNNDSTNNTEGWSNIVEKLAESKDGTSYSIDLSGGSQIPVTILEAIKGKNVDVTINLGNGIEWIINGTDIQGDQDNQEDQGENDPAQQPKTINLQVAVVTDAIPKDALANLETQDSIELSLAYTGDFGFKATLKMSINEENRGKIANLFYYNPITQMLELQGACRVDNNGNILLDFTHASNYIIVMDDKVIVEEAIKLVSMPIQSSTLYVGGTKDKSMKLKLNIPDSIKQVIEDGLSKGSITYSSSNPKVAKVSADGKVSAIAAGKTTITTTIVIDGITRSFKTKIIVKKAHIVIREKLNNMTVGDTFTFVAVGYGVDTSDIVWTTEKRSILVINKKTGKARARSVGTDYVIGKAGGITTRVKVVITK